MAVASSGIESSTRGDGAGAFAVIGAIGAATGGLGASTAILASFLCSSSSFLSASASALTISSTNPIEIYCSSIIAWFSAKRLIRASPINVVFIFIKNIKL